MMLFVISTLVVPKALVIPSEILKKVITALIAFIMLFAEVLELTAIVVQVVLVHLFAVFGEEGASLWLDLNVFATWFCAEVGDALKWGVMQQVSLAIWSHCL